MKSGIISFFILLLSCSNQIRSEDEISRTESFLPEIKYLLESGVPISEAMMTKKYPDNWRGNLQAYNKNFNVFLGSSSVEIRHLSIRVGLNDKFNSYRFVGEGKQKEFHFIKGYINSISYSEPVNVPDQGSYQKRVGIGFNFKEGKLETLGCYFQQDPCGEAIHLNPQGEVTKVTREKTQCKKGCGHLVIYRIPGSYFIADNKVRVRKEPSTKSEIITELNKDTPIEVIADAEVYEEVFPHYGTWGKVKLDDGTEGYVYGAFLRAPAEPDVVAIREKAEEWKKKNGWKRK
ncbi:SH3 domain-containing protein [Leptospira sp. WS39.C2]